MRDEMLFIDGELVDLDDNTKITLNIKSNLFTDLSKIVSNNSYTIKLPKTVRNQRIIQHADLPACNTDYPRKFHQGRYLRNGVEIVHDAKVALISVSDCIEMAMTWGNYVALSNIIEGDKMLTDLPHVSDGGPYAGSDYREWKNWGENSAEFPKIDYGFNEEETEVWYHPVEYVSRIIERISKANGVELKFPDKTKDVLDKLFIPLLTRNDSDEFAEKCAISVSIKGCEMDSIVNQYTLYFEKNNTSNYYGRMYSLHSDNTNSYSSFITNGKPRLYGDFSIIVQSSETPSSIALNVHKANEDPLGANVETDTILEIEPIDIQQMKGEGMYKIIFSFEDEETALLDTKFATYTSYMKFSLAYFTGTVISASGSMKIKNIAEEILMQKRTGSGSMGDTSTDGRFWIVPNLPEIKQIDFIKAISSMLGLFAVAGVDNSITFVSVDELIQSREKANDWTKKVVASYIDNKPKSIGYNIDGFYQRNNYTWKEDDSVHGNYDGYLVVKDDTLEYEADVVTMPFAATDTPVNIPKIPIYSYDSSGNLEYSDVEPRILKIDGVNGSFKDMDWESILEKNYSSFQKMIYNPIVITEKIEIGDVELRDIDVTVPVYLAQYGRYYAIISIKAENTGICECELLQLEV